MRAATLHVKRIWRAQPILRPGLRVDNVLETERFMSLPRVGTTRVGRNRTQGRIFSLLAATRAIIMCPRVPYMNTRHSLLLVAALLLAVVPAVGAGDPPPRPGAPGGAART